MEWQWGDFTKVRDELGTILHKMLEYKPANRYESADAILDVLTPRCQPTEISALPISSPQPTLSLGLTRPLPFLSRSWVYGITVIIMGLLGGSYGFFNLLPHLSQFCHLSIYCVSEQRLREQYYQYNQEGLGAIAGIKWVENRQDLAAIEERLGKTIENMSIISSDAPIFPQVQSSLRNYQQVQQQISDRLVIIQEVEMSLAELEATGSSYVELTKAALNSASVNQMEKAKRKWQDLRRNYQKLPDDELLTTEKQSGIENANSQIETLQSRINQRIAEIEAARQEAIRIQEEQERQERLKRQREETLKQQTRLNPSNSPQPILH
jgi:serine/threonine protein kinase